MAIIDYSTMLLQQGILFPEIGIKGLSFMYNIEATLY